MILHWNKTSLIYLTLTELGNKYLTLENTIIQLNSSQIKDTKLLDTKIEQLPKFNFNLNSNWFASLTVLPKQVEMGPLLVWKNVNVKCQSWGCNLAQQAPFELGTLEDQRAIHCDTIIKCGRIFCIQYDMMILVFHVLKGIRW